MKDRESFRIIKHSGVHLHHGVQYEIERKTPCSGWVTMLNDNGDVIFYSTFEKAEKAIYDLVCGENQRGPERKVVAEYIF